MYNDIKVKFRQNHDRLGMTMFVYFEDRNGAMFLTDFKEMKFEHVDRGEVQPSFYLPPDIFNALKEEILREFRGQNSTFVEGKLDATEKHLQDMRTLLKLK